MRFKILPFDNYTLASKLSIEEVKKRISENIEPVKYFRFIFASFNKPFEGEIAGDSFKISRVTLRSAFNPIFTGDINNYLGQTFIKINIRPKVIVMVLIGVWLLSTLFSSLSFFENLFLQPGKNNFSGYSFNNFMILIVFYSIILVTFKIKSDASKKFLASLLEGETESY